MKLVRFEFNGWLLALMEDSNGNVYCTSRVLCNALGLSARDLKNVARRYRSRLTPARVGTLEVQNEPLRRFLEEYKATFSIKRLRDDMLLWPLKEALGVAFHVHTDLAWQFHQSAIELILERARATSVSREEFDALQAQVTAAKPALLEAASAAGKALHAQMDIKALMN